VDWDAYHYVRLDMAQGELRVDNIDDEDKPGLKLALKEVKLAKKELTAEKRAITLQIQEARSEHRAKQAQRTPMIRGRGGLNRFIRGAQSASRSYDRSMTSQTVQPLEERKFLIDKMIGGLDHLAIQLERLAM
jgi:hypothetical protein